MRSLIVYATKYGSVEKAADMLKSKMNGEVELVNITKERVPSLDDMGGRNKKCQLSTGVALFIRRYF